MQVLESVLQWAAHNSIQRQPHLACLMEHVRLPLLSQVINLIHLNILKLQINMINIIFLFFRNV